MDRKRKTGERVDRRLKRLFPSMTGRQIDEAITAGLVLNDRGKRVPKGLRLEEGEEIATALLSEHLQKLRRGNSELEISIVAETEEVWAVDKPAGIASHPLSLFDDKTVTHWALARFPALGTEFPEVQPILTPHRLDTGTSGLLLVAKTRSAYEGWRQRFQSHELEKTYLAWCWGAPRWSQADCAWPIAHAPGDSSRMVALSRDQRHRPPVMAARSSIEVLERRGEAFLARVTCRTGVTHQVRVHLASLGTPLVGDRVYDPHWELRELKCDFHKLRAVALRTPAESFQLPVILDMVH